MRIRCTEGNFSPSFSLPSLPLFLLSLSLFLTCLYTLYLYILGLSLHTFHGNFFVRSTDLLSLPNVNPDHGYCMNMAIDESLVEYQMVCFQAALLYTSYRGRRERGGRERERGGGKEGGRKGEREREKRNRTEKKAIREREREWKDK